MSRLQIVRHVTAAAFLVSSLPTVSRACPFCSAPQMTFAEELVNSDAAVIARLITKPVLPDVDLNAPGAQPAAPAKSTFEIVKILKGAEHLKDQKKIEVLFFGQQEPGTDFLLYGVDPKGLAWGTPTPLSEHGVEYISALSKLPDATVERLAFFQKYLEDPDSLLSSDAYNEFAKAPYADVAGLKPRMNREHLLTWIKDPDVATSRRRLYLMMLGVCGQPDDVPLVEQMIKNDDRQSRTALDAMIGCYLSLKGADGLALVEDLFLKNDKADYVDTWSTIQALRIIGQETTIVSRDRLVAALRHMLNRPQLADLVISDLARWQDWSSMDHLVKLFKEANEENSFVRVPVVQFLQQCPDPKAKDYLKELAQIDPDAVKRAAIFPVAPPAPAPAKGANADAATADAAKVDPPKADATKSDSATSDAGLESPPAGSTATSNPGPATASQPAATGLQKKSSTAGTNSDAETDAPAASAAGEPPTTPSPAKAPDATAGASSAQGDLPPRAVDAAADSSADELLLAQDKVADGSRESAAPSPPVNPSGRGRKMLIAAFAVGGLLLLLLLVIVRRPRETG